MIIYSQKLAAKLMLKGFVLQGMDKDKRNNGKNVFYFKDSEELKKSINEILNQK